MPKKSLFNFVRYFDFLGSPFSMNYKNSKTSTFTTPLGGIVTICCGFVMLVASSFIVYQLLDSEKVDLTITEVASKTPPSYDLYKSKYFVSFGVTHGLRLLDPNNGENLPNFFTIIGRAKAFSIDYSQEPPSFNHTYKTFEYVPCVNSTEYINTAFRVHESIAFWIDRIGYCPMITEDTNYLAMGTLLEHPFHEIEIKVYPCSLEDPSQCAS